MDRKKKLTTSGLKNHLLREHSSKPEVRAAYLLDDAEKVVDATQQQTIQTTFILCKIMKMFGFVLNPEVEFSDCVPNKLFKEKDSDLGFAVFSQRMFNKWKTFKLSAGV